MICPTAATLQPLTCNDDDGGDDDAAGDAINDNDNGDDDDLLHTPTTDLQQDKLNSWVKFFVVVCTCCSVPCAMWNIYCSMLGATCVGVQCGPTCIVVMSSVYLQFAFGAECIFSVGLWRAPVAQSCVVCDVQSAFAVCIWRSVHFQCGVCVELH